MKKGRSSLYKSAQILYNFKYLCKNYRSDKLYRDSENIKYLKMNKFLSGVIAIGFIGLINAAETTSNSAKNENSQSSFVPAASTSSSSSNINSDATAVFFAFF